MTLDRREILLGGATLLAAASVADAKRLPPPPPPKTPPKPGAHVAVPLAFKPSVLTGISEKMIVSHHAKNYAGAVKNLNAVELELATLKIDMPGYAVAALREKELTYYNSMVLHEHYFGNLGGNGKRSGALDTRLTTELGAAGWEARMRAVGLGLGGGSGWAVLALGLHDGGLRIAQSANHTQALTLGVPLMVLDMYEHAYAIDYGADHAAYIDAFFRNLAWDVVEARYVRAMKQLAIT